METKFIEVEVDWCEYAWECEECEELWYWEDHRKDHNMNYCPACGRKIVEVVEWEINEREGENE